MEITEIRVNRLFGMFDHTISLNQEEGLTIIYGMNGIGKTMIFRMLKAVLNTDFISLSEIPFNKFEIDATEGVSFKFERTLEGIKFFYIKDEKVEEVLFNYNRKDLGKKVPKHYSDRFELRYRNNLKDFYFFIEKNGTSKYIDRNNFLKEFPTLLPNDLKVVNYWRFPKGEENKEDGTLEYDIKEEIKQFKFSLIGTQRLLSLEELDLENNDLEKDNFSLSLGSIYRSANRFPRRTKKTPKQPSFTVKEFVQKYSEELAQTIKAKHETYQQQSEALDLSLGKRLIAKEVKMDFTTIELKEAFEKVENRLEELRRVGLLTNQKIEKITIDDTIDELTKAVISVNVQDLQQKLTIFDELYQKLDLFLDIINKRRFSYKTLKISEEKGFTFENINDTRLTPDELSSGEKHELILIYQLIFTVPENTLIMIDEPELSLHISWQKAFVNDMLEIIKLRNINIVAATHSPAIINGHWDLTVSLNGLDKDEEAYA